MNKKLLCLTVSATIGLLPIAGCHAPTPTTPFAVSPGKQAALSAVEKLTGQRVLPADQAPEPVRDRLLHAQALYKATYHIQDTYSDPACAVVMPPPPPVQPAPQIDLSQILSGYPIVYLQPTPSGALPGTLLYESNPDPSSGIVIILSVVASEDYYSISEQEPTGTYLVIDGTCTPISSPTPSGGGGTSTSPAPLPSQGGGGTIGGATPGPSTVPSPLPTALPSMIASTSPTPVPSPMSSADYQLVDLVKRLTQELNTRTISPSDLVIARDILERTGEYKNANFILIGFGLIGLFMGLSEAYAGYLYFASGYHHGTPSPGPTPYPLDDAIPPAVERVDSQQRDYRVIEVFIAMRTAAATKLAATGGRGHFIFNPKIPVVPGKPPDFTADEIEELTYLWLAPPFQKFDGVLMSPNGLRGYRPAVTKSYSKEKYGSAKQAIADFDIEKTAYTSSPNFTGHVPVD